MRLGPTVDRRHLVDVRHYRSLSEPDQHAITALLEPLLQTPLGVAATVSWASTTVNGLVHECANFAHMLKRTQSGTRLQRDDRGGQ